MIFYLILCKPNSEIFYPSIKILPLTPYSVKLCSNILKNPKVKVLFPEPVLPTTPIFSAGLISKSIPLIINGNSSLYLNATY